MILAMGLPLDGHYVLAEDPAAVEGRRQAAIHYAVEALIPVLRPVGRPILGRAAHPCDTWDLSLDPDWLRVGCNTDGTMWVSRHEGLTVDADGRSYQIRLATGPSELVVTWDGAIGGLRTIYRAEPDGGLVVTRTVHSPHLPEPVVWTARYRRDGP